jgi:hypothetical protein
MDETNDLTERKHKINNYDFGLIRTPSLLVNNKGMIMQDWFNDKKMRVLKPLGIINNKNETIEA